MQGGCFSISSLGGIGGTAFTPIINAPEVAILGVSASRSCKPVWNGKAVRAAPDAAAVAVVRPPRDRRRAGRALHRLPQRRSLRHPPPCPVTSSVRLPASLVTRHASPESLNCVNGSYRHTRRHVRPDPLRASAARRGDRRATLRLDQVRLIPSGTPPHRAAPGVAAEQRLEMVQLAAAGNARFQVDDREVAAAGPGYTFDTLDRTARGSRQHAPALPAARRRCLSRTRDVASLARDCSAWRTSSLRTVPGYPTGALVRAHAAAARARIHGALHAAAARHAPFSRRRHRT